MSIYQVDPIEDTRWKLLSVKHPNASVFHSQGWLKALRNAYGYEPVALTTTPPGRELSNGIVFCQVKSWLTGNRLVSLPFSDHCDPLLDSQAEFEFLLARLRQDPRQGYSKYIEIRPTNSRFGSQAGLNRLKEFRLHRIDLTPPLDAIFHRFHKNVQRNIRRAETVPLRYEKGTSTLLLEHFRRLLTMTRRRHRLPPQPLLWFRSLLDCMGDSVAIRLVYDNQTPIAGILTLRHKDVLVYKYGCSDYRHRSLCGMAFVLWRAIQEAHQEGVRTFDLGRSDRDNLGLITFKERWGSIGSTLTYWSCGEQRFRRPVLEWTSRRVQQILPYLPDRFLANAGRILYRHAG